MKRFITVLLLVILLAGLPVSAAERKLTCDRIVQVSNTQIVLEFSEPIAINLHGSNYGPYVAVRMVSSTGGLARISNIKSVNYGEYMQWDGTLEYLDSKHDRLIWTFNDEGHLGCNDINDIRNRIGELSEEGYDKYLMALVMEEVPFTEPCTDMAICNVTTADGEVFLSPTNPTAWEKLVVEFETDYGYRIDESAIEGISKGEAGFTAEYDGSAVALGTLTPEAEETEIPTVEVVKNDPLVIALILGGSGLVCAVLLIILLVGCKKRKAVR